MIADPNDIENLHTGFESGCVRQTEYLLQKMLDNLRSEKAGPLERIKCPLCGEQIFAKVFITFPLTNRPVLTGHARCPSCAAFGNWEATQKWEAK